MPVARVQLPDGRIGRFEVPEGTTPEQVIAYAEKNLAAAQSEAEPRSGMQELGRQGGLAARYLAEGGAGLVGIAADPIGALLSKATGQPYQPLQQYVGDKLTQAGMPQPESPLERVVGGASRGLVGGGGSVALARGVAPAMSGTAQNVARLLADNRGAQLVGGAGAGAGGQTAAESGGGAVSQLLASLAGGVVAPASMRVIPAAGRGVKALAEPFWQGGRENIVGSAMNRLKSTPDAASRAAQSGEILPGSAPTTAQATRDIGLANLERGMRNDPERGPRIAHRIAEQRDAQADALNSIAKDANALKAAIAERETVSSDLYGKAKSAAVVPDATLGALSKRPSMQEAIKIAQGVAAERGSAIKPGEFLHEVKMALDGMIDTAPQKGIVASQNNAVKSTRADYLKWLEAKVPEYGKARATYAKMSEPINQLEAAQDLRRSVQNAEQTPKGNPVISQAKFFQQFTNDRADLRKTMSRQQIELLERIAKDLDRGAFSDTGGKAVGSPTIQNLSTAHFLGRMLGGKSADSALWNTAVRPLAWIMKIPNAKAQDLLYDAMLDPKLAARLMHKPTAKDVDFLNATLLKKYAAMTAGAGVGATSVEPR